MANNGAALFWLSPQNSEFLTCSGVGGGGSMLTEEAGALE